MNSPGNNINPPLAPGPNGTSSSPDSQDPRGDYPILVFIVGGIVAMFLIGVVLLVVAVMSDWKG